MEVGSTDGTQEALGCVIYCFLMKLTDEKKLVTDRPMDGPTDGRIHLHIEMRGRI